MTTTDPVRAERDALADLTQRQKEAIRELSSELVEVAQRSPQALTLLQLEAVVNERDALSARLAAVEALAEGPTGDGYQPYAVQIDGQVNLAVLLDDLRAALEGDR